MSKVVTLEYKRVQHHYEGLFRYADGQAEQMQQSFSMEYEEMLKRLCVILENTCEAEQEVDVVLQRTDRAGLTPVSLDKQVVNLLRTDPAAGVAALTYTPPETPLTAVTRKRAETTQYVPAPLRAGIETLAQAFGGLVYARVRDGKVECPCCGFWIRNVPQVPDGGMSDFIGVCAERCKMSLELRVYSRWAAISTSYLLGLSADRFYLPREWNTGKPWISKADLQTKYDTFKKEKEKIHG